MVPDPIADFDSPSYVTRLWDRVLMLISIPGDLEMYMLEYGEVVELKELCVLLDAAIMRVQLHQARRMGAEVTKEGSTWRVQPPLPF